VKRVFSVVLVVCLVSGTFGGVAAAEQPSAPAVSTGDAEIGTLQSQNGTATPTPTNESNSTTGSGSDEGNATTQADADAQLYIEQPRHVSTSVDTTTTQDGIVYTANGRVLELDPQNFDPADVVRAGVREDAATLRFDKSIGRYILDTQGTAGTYRLMFRTRVDGEVTTYHATVQVEQAEYAHVAPWTLEELRDQADQYDWIVSQFSDAGLMPENPSEDRIEAVIEDAVTWYVFYDNPLSGLSGQFLSFGIMLIRWPAGWVILGTIFIVAFWRVGKDEEGEPEAETPVRRYRKHQREQARGPRTGAEANPLDADLPGPRAH